MKHRRLVAMLATALAVAATGAGTAVAGGYFSHHHRDHQHDFESAFHSHEPRNVIFLLGDGMGTQEITAARYYQGVSNELNVDQMPFTGFDTTWSVKPAAAPPYLPDYDPDSASTGTMWATGQKTLDERISQTKGAGGLGSIAEQEVDHKVDVLLGGGRNRFAQTIGSGPDVGKTVIQSAQA
jgi:alkaline phosphatase